jgi:hypothetical protein
MSVVINNKTFPQQQQTLLHASLRAATRLTNSATTHFHKLHSGLLTRTMTPAGRTSNHTNGFLNAASFISLALLCGALLVDARDTQTGGRFPEVLRSDTSTAAGRRVLRGTRSSRSRTA